MIAELSIAGRTDAHKKRFDLRSSCSLPCRWGIIVESYESKQMGRRSTPSVDRCASVVSTVGEDDDRRTSFTAVIYLRSSTSSRRAVSSAAVSSYMCSGGPAKLGPQQPNAFSRTRTASASDVPVAVGAKWVFQSDLGTGNLRYPQIEPFSTGCILALRGRGRNAFDQLPC